jgi:hypothetical protein
MLKTDFKQLRKANAIEYIGGAWRQGLALECQYNTQLWRE